MSIQATNENKIKYSYPEMINHMKEKGITFNIASEKDARKTLDSVNYYFKLTAFRKNFSKQNNIYKDLDFAYLQDVAAIDFQLRTFLLDMCLSVEHSIKTTVLDLITMNKEEDGYSIVNEFAVCNPDTFAQVMSYLRSNKYSQNLYDKHKSHVSVWVFLEVATFGALSEFLDFYNNKYPTKRTNNLLKFLKYAKHIRNAAAHSNPILINLFSQFTYLPLPSGPVSDAASRMKISHSDLHDLKINDLVSLFELFNLLASDSSKGHTKRHGERVIKRFNRHKDYYDNAPNIIRFKETLTILIDSII